jgi:hypothetical protein
MNEEISMTMSFQKNLFNYSGGYLTYGPDRLFIARFKYRGGMGPKKADFIRLLCKYYTTKDWFAKAKTDAPVRILEKDGFVKYDLENRRVLIAK